MERIYRAGGEENEPSRAGERRKLTSICMHVCEKKIFSFLNRFCESLFFFKLRSAARWKPQNR